MAGGAGGQPVAPTPLAEALLPLVEAAGGRMAALSSEMGSVAGMWRVIAGLPPSASGAFVDYRGAAVSW